MTFEITTQGLQRTVMLSLFFPFINWFFTVSAYFKSLCVSLMVVQVNDPQWKFSPLSGFKTSEGRKTFFSPHIYHVRFLSLSLWGNSSRMHLLMVVWVDTGPFMWVDMTCSCAALNPTRSFSLSTIQTFSQDPKFLFGLSCASSPHVHSTQCIHLTHLLHTMLFFHLLTSSASAFDVSYPGIEGILSQGILCRSVLLEEASHWSCFHLLLSQLFSVFITLDK